MPVSNDSHLQITNVKVKKATTTTRIITEWKRELNGTKQKENVAIAFDAIVYDYINIKLSSRYGN